MSTFTYDRDSFSHQCSACGEQSVCRVDDVPLCPTHTQQRMNVVKAPTR